MGEKSEELNIIKKTGEIKYRRYAIRNGTKRYIDARLTTVNGRAGIQSMIESKRRFDIRVTDLPLFIETDNNQYGQLHGKTIVDDYGLKTIIIVSTAEKNTGNCIGLVVSDKRVKGEQYISENDVSTRANPIQYKLMEDMGMFEFEKEHPYHSDIQKIHGIGAHEEEHALREIINKKQEEINALNTEKKERLQFIDENGID